MTEHLEIIKQHIVNNERTQIMLYLDNIHESKKGIVFEHFISELYCGNGWLTEIKGSKNDKGADILVRHPSEPNRVKFIIQAKNHKTKLNKKDTLSELNQFKEEASKVYNCNQYRLISLNGFVEDAFLFEKYNLRLESWQHIEKLLDNYKKERHEAPEIGLHSHNKTTYNNVIELWKKNKRVAIIQATGTGKSYIIFKAISDFQNKKKILITPSKVILNQFKENFDYGWLIDENVNAFLYQNRNNFLESNISNHKADLIILDEFHRIGAKKWKKKIEKLLENNPDAYVLGTSATPIRYLDGKRDMAEEFFNGVRAAELTLPEAIVKNIIPNPTYIASLISLDEEIENILLEIKKSRLTDEEKENTKTNLLQKQLEWENSKGVPEILKKYLTNKDLKKIIVFCEGIDHLDKMEIEVEGWFQKAAFRNRIKYRVHSKQTESENKAILKNFQEQPNDKIALLFAVDMLNEGMHIASVDGVILLRPTESPIIFYQQIGRCLQVGNTNPIIFDLVNNFSSIKANNFLNDLNIAKNEEQKQLHEDGVYDNIPEFKVTDETKEIVELFDSISIKLNTWEIWYDLLSEYKEIHKHSSPSHRDKFKGENLGYWVGEQRRKKNQLTLSQIARLNELDFDWGEERKTGPLDRLEINRKNLSLLENYYRQHNTCSVPKREPKTEKGKIAWSKELSTWFHHSLKPKLIYEYERNQEYFTYENEGILIPMIEFLNKIGIKDAYKKRVVEIAINRLKKEHKINPSFNQRDFQDLIAKDKKFYNKVVNKLRNYYHETYLGNESELENDYFKKGEIELLESLGWTWTSIDKKNWEDYFQELRQIFIDTGSCYLKQNDNHTLFLWCKGQRQKKHLLTPEQIAKLNSIEFPWVVKKLKSSIQPKNDRKFENNAKKLLNYRNDNGDFIITRSDDIYEWIRKLKLTGTTDERKKILLVYGFDLDREIEKTKNKISKAY